VKTDLAYEAGVFQQTYAQVYTRRGVRETVSSTGESGECIRGLMKAY